VVGYRYRIYSNKNKNKEILAAGFISVCVYILSKIAINILCMAKLIRLNKAVANLNISSSRIVEFLSSKGVNVDNDQYKA
jgi:hypothetical protein